MELQQLLTETAQRKASDLHLKPGSKPILRIHGHLEVQDDLPQVTREFIDAMAKTLLGERRLNMLMEGREMDLGYMLPGIGRFRCNLFLAMGEVRGVFRHVPERIPAFHELHLPKVLERLSMERRGMILVTGITGSGKSTSLASMIDFMNRSRNDHIVTIEDPIEFAHRSQGCLVTQREIGTDSRCFSNALRSVLRQDPDFILVGEMRDLETIEAALVLAETGHLTFGTLHTSDAVQTINRIIDVFPAHQQQQVRTQLSFTLEAVFCQQLLPAAAGHGRVLAAEIMLANPAIRALIREGKGHQIYSQIQTGARLGMNTMSAWLANLVRSGKLRLEDAEEAVSDPNEFRMMLKGAA